MVHSLEDVNKKRTKLIAANIGSARLSAKRVILIKLIGFIDNEIQPTAVGNLPGGRSLREHHPRGGQPGDVAVGGQQRTEGAGAAIRHPVVRSCWQTAAAQRAGTDPAAEGRSPDRTGP